MEKLITSGSDIIVVPAVKDCIELISPSYVDNERLLRVLNDRFQHLAINGIIYITKETFCYLVESEGIVDFPVMFLERVKIDGFLFLYENPFTMGSVIRRIGKFRHFFSCFDVF